MQQRTEGGANNEYGEGNSPQVRTQLTLIQAKKTRGAKLNIHTKQDMMKVKQEPTHTETR